MRSLLPAPTSAEPDVRPTLLGIVTLLFLLLFFLLTTSTGERLAAVDLHFRDPSDVVSLPHTGLVKRLDISISNGEARLQIEVQTTDIAAAATSVEVRQVVVPAQANGRLDLVALNKALGAVKQIDPAQEQATLTPSDDLTVAELLRLLDVVRGPPGAALYPKLTLGGA